ncbi:MAG: 2,3-bisphosphoglycerate-independent phosphoglycerate mutase [Deltaproteobacteria bacterium]|nr:2,3-bisphosphoglycerate-independent phosphoglycerate mutase [Deltaproteobacteria bacterium]MBW2417117.1 2,3-bisphosphoglycerate-independent phosphoglycerate mutase [Deltaproteobacteria bacterium]
MKGGTQGPVMLVILDGYGIGDGGSSDATAIAHAPFFERAKHDYANAQLETSGRSVGLPPGQMGNSEVGHMTMGAGRVIDQDLTRISKAFDDGDIEANAAIQSTFAAVEASGGTLHFMGLLSDGGVHSHQEHLYALLATCAKRGIPTALHVFLDGRDTPPRSGLGFVRELMPHVEAAGSRVSTVSGRYYAMDRDNRWKRVQLAYDAIVCGEGEEAQDAVSAVEASYARPETDEFVKPTVIAGGRSVEDGDGIFFFNFRADRAREITNALTSVCPDRFEGELERKRVPVLAAYMCMTEYDADFGLPVAYPSRQPRDILGEVVAKSGLHQLRMAETEKYAHVTFFFNNGLEEPFPGEDRVLVPSPREVDTYDHKPEMSALQLTEKLLAQIEEGDYAFILVNYANPDMVGHTGVLSAAVKAVETIDSCLEKITRAVMDKGGQALVTADHGNCELMIDPESGEPHTAHTTNPVPIYWLTRDSAGRALRDGTLADLAPTVLDLLGIEIPQAMTGRPLIG